MFGLGQLGKLALGGLAVLGAWTGIKVARSKLGTYQLTANHLYAIKVRFTGAGGGGPISTSQLQAMLTGERLNIAVGPTSTDNTNKLVTYLATVVANAGDTTVTSAKAASLANLPSPWGPASVVSVDDLGMMTV